ncbi:MAG TPA: glucans biosynthesis glucosyltransferase MdoH [Aliidongia sp.]|nr:glucans biosynthesis glucosyltransferase MdoH [Aliidongia sp.]
MQREKRPGEAPMVIRRVIFWLVVAASAVFATYLMSEVMAANGLTPVRLGVLVLFTASFTWLIVSFWTAILGFIVRLGLKDPVSLAEAGHVRLRERTAIIMPIYNEDTERVAAGLEATMGGMTRTEWGRHFDLFVLSDTTDQRIATAELAMVAALRARHPDGVKLYYRRRQPNIGRKAGNIEDFITRWGGAYAHMIVLDADSIMSEDTLVALAQMMEANPDSGIIQTIPTPVNRETPFARILQFAARLYMPVMAYGLAFLTRGEGIYFGHNAIIRIAAFARYCALPVLPGAAPLGGEILSHDFVEAALMQRAGYKVWIVPELTGSFEELPANVIDYAKRDRRWCQGNMQHGRLLGVPGLKRMSRLQLFMGVTSYLTSPLWLLLLILSTIDAVQRALQLPVYFKPGYNLFPDWPVATDAQIDTLLGITLAALFLPKLLGAAMVMASRSERRLYGGFAPLVASIMVEMVFSALLAPMMMLFQTNFVVSTLLGRSISWDAQPRDDRGLSWREGMRRHGLQTMIGLVWGLAIFELAPDFFWWMSPITLALVLAIPLSVLSSRARLGLWLKWIGLFVTPEETRTPIELRRMRRALVRGLPSLRGGVGLLDYGGELTPPESRLEMTRLPWSGEIGQAA